MSLPSGNNFLALVGRFATVGILNSGIGFLVIFLLMYAGIDPYVSNVAGYCVGFLVSFGLHKGWVYRSGGHVTPEAAKYVVAVAISYLLNMACLALLLNAHVWPYAAQVFAAVLYTGSMFVLSTYWVFAGRASHE
ncbi:GtrA family protein [Devosia geojensis]|uniref:GtrA family protein n=1 Tax=Devosia geojensis TaxID=443610 RepID=UPI00069877F1|nr:GtrA family protein [Devosia geojensis]